MANIIIKMKIPIPIRIKYVFIESSLVFAPEKNHILPATVKEVKQIVEYSYTFIKKSVIYFLADNLRFMVKVRFIYQY